MFRPLLRQYCKFVNVALINPQAACTVPSSVGIQKAFFSSERLGKILALNDLTYIAGSRKVRKRVGRGVGSGLGKTSGHGHQMSRSTPRAFEGGQTPLYKRLPKIGFTNSGAHDYQILNLQVVQDYIDMGRLKVKPNELITMRDLYDCGIISRVKDGIKLLAKGKARFTHPIHLEVTCASGSAIKTVEAAGGTVTAVHFNKLALRALIKPTCFSILPRRARPPPKIIGLYLDKTMCGFLSPEIQLRNTQLFGTVTSEDKCRKEHLQLMELNRLRTDESRKEKLILVEEEIGRRKIQSEAHKEQNAQSST